MHCAILPSHSRMLSQMYFSFLCWTQAIRKIPWHLHGPHCVWQRQGLPALLPRKDTGRLSNLHKVTGRRSDLNLSSQNWTCLPSHWSAFRLELLDLKIGLNFNYLPSHPELPSLHTCFSKREGVLLRKGRRCFLRGPGNSWWHSWDQNPDLQS